MNQVENELFHFGVLGMKWGVRRYQNKDGSLTPIGKKKISKEYKKYSVAGDKNLLNDYNDIYMRSYNKAAGKMNDGGIDKFNREQEKKYGKNFAKRKGYDEDFENAFSKVMEKEMNNSFYEYRFSDSNYQKADALVKKYDMASWDDLAKNNEEAISYLRDRYG